MNRNYINGVPKYFNINIHNFIDFCYDAVHKIHEAEKSSNHFCDLFLNSLISNRVKSNIVQCMRGKKITSV